MYKLIKFVDNAIEVNGAEDHQVPANTKLDDWSADKWQEIVNILKADGMAYATNLGTFLKQGTLGDLREALSNNAYPYPTTVASRHVAAYQARTRDV